MKAGWISTKLGVIFDIRDGTHDSPKYLTSGYPLITSKNLKSGLLDFGDIKYISEADYQKINARSAVHLGDILFAMIGTIGNPTIVTSEPNFAIKNVALFKANKLQNNAFLKYYLESPFVTSKMSKEANGTTHKFVGLGYLRNFPIELPPLAEQQRIVSILDQAFEGIATATANAEKNLANARKLFDSYLESTFVNSSMGWPEKRLVDICNFVGGSQPPKSVFENTSSVENVRLIQIRDYKSDKHLVYIPRKLAKRFCKPDDVMIGRYGPPIFQILKGLEGAYNVALMKAVPDEKQLLREYLFYFLKHPSIQKYVIFHSERAAGQSGLNKERLEPYPIIVPPLGEQRLIVEKVIDLENECQRLEVIYQQKLSMLNELKKSILHQAFTGQLN